MKFNRADLITRVEAEIARREKLAGEKHAEAQREYGKARARHTAQTLEPWREFGRTIARRCRAGDPVHVDDIPVEVRSRYGGTTCVNVWDKAAPEPKTADVGNLHALLAMLQACTDDEVSTVAIERTGFRMAHLFRQ